MAGGHGEGINYKGLTMHKPKRWHVVTGKGLCAVMWLVVILHCFSPFPASNPRFDLNLVLIWFWYILIFRSGLLLALDCWIKKNKNHGIFLLLIWSKEADCWVFIVIFVFRFWVLYRAKQDGPVVLVRVDVF
jgi:uncharacterized protein YhhL (DUF1145 family)